MTTLVDTNVLIDVISDDKLWADRSLAAIRNASDCGTLAINLIVYAELSAGYAEPEQFDELLIAWRIIVIDIPRQAAFLAGKAF